MLIINKDNGYIVDRGDFYSISTINSNDSVVVELDKRLHVDGSVSVAGDMQCEDIVVDGTLTVSGNFLSKNIQADSIFLFGVAKIEGNLLVNRNVQFGKAYITGTLISHGALHSISELVVDKNMSIATTAVLKSSIDVGGDIFIGGMFDAHSSILCGGKVKIAGVEVGTFGRYNNGEYVIVVTDKVLAVKRGTSSAEIIEDYDKHIQRMKNDESYSFKERDDFVMSNKDIFDIISTEIRARSK